MRGKAKLGNGFGGYVARLLAGHDLLLAKPEGDILPDRKRVEQGPELERHAETPTHRFELVPAGMDHFFAIDLD